MPKKRKKKPTKWGNLQVDSDLELIFLKHWTMHYPDKKPMTQFTFHPTRKFRFDFCWPMHKIALEVQGYGPGHNSLIGMTQDYDKNMEAMLHNWKIMYITSIHLSPPRIDDTVAVLAKLLKLPPPSQEYIPLSKRGIS